MFADERQQFDIGAPAVMLGRLAQGQRQFLVGADPQQALVAGAEVFGGFLRLLQLQVQVGQVVMGK